MYLPYLKLLVQILFDKVFEYQKTMLQSSELHVI